MSLPEKVAISTSLLTDLGDAVRERFGVSGDLTIEEMTEIVRLLPSEYQQVDYITADSTQYIDTGVPLSSVTKITAKLALDYPSTTGSGGAFLYGIRASSSSARFLTMIQHDTSETKTEIAFKIGNGTDTTYSKVFAQTPISQGVTLSEFQSIIRIDNRKALCGFDEIEFYTTVTMSSPTGNIHLFGINNNGTHSQQACSISCYEFEIDNGTAARHFIPCYRKADNVIGLYDIINNQFYTNAGSGSFTCYPSPT